MPEDLYLSIELIASDCICLVISVPDRLRKRRGRVQLLVGVAESHVIPVITLWPVAHAICYFRLRENRSLGLIRRGLVILKPL